MNKEIIIEIIQPNFSVQRTPYQIIKPLVGKQQEMRNSHYVFVKNQSGKVNLILAAIG